VQEAHLLARRDIIRTIEKAANTAQAENDREAGRPVERDTFVNGRIAEVEDITVPGTIVFVWSFNTYIYDEAKELVERLSPVRTGRYRRSFRLLINGDEAAWGTKPPIDAEVMIVNVQPYARKLEVRARDGILEAAGAILRRRYGQLVDITFQYINLAPPVWVTRQGKPVPTPAIRIAPDKARRTSRAVRGSRGRGR
jgi:hypothetical protein